MLHHFHAGYHIVAVRVFRRQILHADAAVAHIVHAAHPRVRLGRLQRFFRQIDAGYRRRAAPRHALGEDAAAAAHIQHYFARQIRFGVDIV